MTSDVAAIVERARLAAKTSPAAETPDAQREQLKRIAAEFESMLLVQVLKDMRRSGSWEEEGGQPEGFGLGAESLFETLDVELASHLARVKGMGLGKQLEEAFDRINPMTMPLAPVAVPQPETGETRNRADRPSPASPRLRPSTAAQGATTHVAGRGSEKAEQDNPVIAAVKTVAEATVDAPKAVVQLLKPVAGAVTSAFGWRNHPITGQMKFHQGVDLRAAYGQDVNAAAAGQVVFSGEQGAYGSTVVVQHADGTKTRYAHLSARLVAKGDEIAAGEPLGRAGKSGRATGTHLHFEVMAADGRRIRPDQWAAAGDGIPAPVAVKRSTQDRGPDAD